MSSEILAVLEYMEKEKGISREDMIATIEGAVKAAAERAINSSGDIRVEISPKTGAMEGLDPIGSGGIGWRTRPGKFTWTRPVCMLKVHKPEMWWSVTNGSFLSWGGSPPRPLSRQSSKGSVSSRRNTFTMNSAIKWETWLRESFDARKGEISLWRLAKPRPCFLGANVCLARIGFRVSVSGVC